MNTRQQCNVWFCHTMKCVGFEVALCAGKHVVWCWMNTAYGETVVLCWIAVMFCHSLTSILHHLTGRFTEQCIYMGVSPTRSRCTWATHLGAHCAPPLFWERPYASSTALLKAKAGHSCVYLHVTGTILTSSQYFVIFTGLYVINFSRPHLGIIASSSDSSCCWL